MDYRGSNAGNVSFSKHLYTDTDVTSVKLFRETEIFAKTYGDVKTFQPTVILIVTWKKANPYPYTSNNNSKEVWQIFFLTMLYFYLKIKEIANGKYNVSSHLETKAKASYFCLLIYIPLS